MKITNRRMKEEINMRKSKPSWSKHEQEINSTNQFNGLYFFFVILGNVKRFLVVAVILDINSIFN
jgi:hypothetical protein